MSYRLLECIANVDGSLNDDQFREILDLMDPKKSPAILEKYEKLHTKTMSFLIKRSQLFIMKPTKLTEDLLDLGFSESKTGIFVKQYTDTLKPILNRLESDTGEVNELKDLSWKLEVELVSSGLNRKQRTKAPIGQINLDTTCGTDSLQLDHKGLSELFDALEDMQSEVDSMKTFN